MALSNQLAPERPISIVLAMLDETYLLLSSGIICSIWSMKHAWRTTAGMTSIELLLQTLIDQASFDNIALLPVLMLTDRLSS